MSLVTPPSASAQPLPYVGGRSSWSQYLALTKPRLSLMSVITALVGYVVADPQSNPRALLVLVLGTSLAAGGAAALNQWLEREVDGRMARTASRPLVVGSISPAKALIFGLILSVLGSAMLGFYYNALTALLTVATIVSYVLVYTPLKQRTLWCTHIGAIPGALPPLIGWAAAQDAIGGLGVALFIMLFAWQIPHFMAIAWTYRKDYAEANMPMATVVDTSGKLAAREAIIYAWVTLAASLAPCFMGKASLIYGVLAGLAGGYFVYCAYLFKYSEFKDQAARKLFFASISYLPWVLLLLVLDHWLLS
ncbi:MAG: protoheme IX farnesyltransferase [Verrucomicrobia bacterium 21-51-4]|nr:MAG: protoheme IX farnesyltransferase [Verrucomicrobia bacterium 21-51-4]HQU08895.1 heme o synthase [Opitutales bacterium]